MGGKMQVVTLFETSGWSADEWAQNGYEVWCYDKLTPEPRQERCGAGWKIWMPWDARDEAQNARLVEWHRGQAALVLAFPPCEDLATTGAQHFERKSIRDPDFHLKAMALVKTAVKIAEELDAPYAIENPVGMISTYWRSPDYIWNPWEYGGYLPENDVHPIFPEYIAGRDAYKKKTCFWAGGGFIMPERRPVQEPKSSSLQHLKLGGRRAKTKEVRSMSPRGMNRAIYIAHIKGG